MQKSEQTRRLGDILVERGAIAREALEQHALATKTRIGDYLRAHNIVGGQTLVRGLAEQYVLAFVEFEKAPPDETLFSPRDLTYYIAHHFVPYAREGDTLIVATSEPSPLLKPRLETHYGKEVHVICTGPRDLWTYFANVAATASTRQARLSLRRKYRHLVADRTLLPFQIRGILMGLAALIGAFAVAPHWTWHALLVVCNLFYLTSIAIKWQFYKNGQLQQLHYLQREPDMVQDVASLNDASLPIYSILVPLYRESSAVMARLITSLSALDYPREKLEIKLICEADDLTTMMRLNCYNRRR